MTGRTRRLIGIVAPTALLVGGVVLVVLGNTLGGLALVIAGWFARIAVRADRRREALERLVEGITVGEIMETEPLVVAPQATLDTFADWLAPDGRTTVARVTRDDQLLGLVGARELARVPRDRWPLVHASEAMAPAASLPSLAPGDPLRPAANRLGASAASGFPVLDGGRVAGILTRLAVGRTLHERTDGAAPGANGDMPGADGGSPGADGATPGATHDADGASPDADHDVDPEGRR